MTRLREPGRGVTPTTPIGRHLTERSGYYVAEAWGLVVAKLVALALAGLAVWVIVLMAQDGGWGVFAAGPFLLAAIALALWTGLVPFNGLVRERLRPEVRFRRLRGAAPRAAEPEPEPEPEAASARRRPRAWTAVLLVLSAPVAVLVVHILSAYVEELAGYGTFDWLAWGYQGVAIDPLFTVTNRWPLVVLAVLAVSLGCGITLLVGAVRAGARSAAARRARARVRRADEPAPVDPTDAVDRSGPVLRSSPRGQTALLSRTALYLVLGLPGASVIGYVLLAYLDHLGLMWSSPVVDEWEWDAPQHFGAFGEWFFADFDRVLALLASISVIFLGVGITLATLAVPVLLRRGADALDLAVTDAGVVTRGGLAIGWSEIADVLVVADRRITALLGSGLLSSSLAINMTFVPGHSRTRVALVLREPAVVAARATRAQRRALYADGDLASGYARADLWIHPADDVTTVVAALEKSAATAGVPVEHLERSTYDLERSMYGRTSDDP